MPAKILSASTIGLNCHLIEVEADISNSTTNFFIVGLPDAAVSEAKERVKSAVKNSGLNFPRTKVTVNLAPADLRKFGPAFDLPMAVAILNCQHTGPKKYLTLTPADQQALFIGELSLDGSLRPVNGILSIAQALAEWKINKIYLPAANAAEASLIEGLEIFAIHNLAELIGHLKGKQLLTPVVKTALPTPTETLADFNFSDIKGQAQAKRALIITAAGHHNLLLEGPPGSGKTLLSRSLAKLLPPLRIEEALEVTKIYSLAGLLKNGQPLISERPFRSPHHTASGIALIGGGAFPKPGEITLAHRGVLFLDEFPEFPRHVLENLRQPLEDGLVTVSRAATSITFPARFTLVAAMNPCPCGYLGDNSQECICAAGAIAKYRKKISGPILDRLDLKITVPRLKEDELIKPAPPAKMQEVKKIISLAAKIQTERLKPYGLLYNSEMDYKLVETICRTDSAGEKLLKEAIARFQLSARAYHKVLKVARTIADLDNSAKIKTEHLAESLQYR